MISHALTSKIPWKSWHDNDCQALGRSTGSARNYAAGLLKSLSDKSRWFYFCHFQFKDLRLWDNFKGENECKLKIREALSWTRNISNQYVSYATMISDSSRKQAKYTDNKLLVPWSLAQEYGQGPSLSKTVFCICRIQHLRWTLV